MKYFKALSYFILLALETTAAAAEISLPKGVSGLLKTSENSAIPQRCRPKNHDANVFVASMDSILPVVEADGSTDFTGFFELSGIFLFDANESGIPEAYGFGTARSSLGGGFPSYLWIDNEGEQFDIRNGPLASNFALGIPLHEEYLEDGLPTLVINLFDWECSVLAYPNGDIANN